MRYGKFRAVTFYTGLILGWGGIDGGILGAYDLKQLWASKDSPPNRVAHAIPATQQHLKATAAHSNPESQVVQNNRPLYHTVAHNSLKVSHKCAPLAFQVLFKTPRRPSNRDQKALTEPQGAQCVELLRMLWMMRAYMPSSQGKTPGDGLVVDFIYFWGKKQHRI